MTVTDFDESDLLQCAGRPPPSVQRKATRQEKHQMVSGRGTVFCAHTDHCSTRAAASDTCARGMGDAPTCSALSLQSQFSRDGGKEPRQPRIWEAHASI